MPRVASPAVARGRDGGWDGTRQGPRPRGRDRHVPDRSSELGDRRAGRSGRARDGRPRSRARWGGRRSDRRDDGVPARGPSLDRARLRGDPRAERFRRADRDQPDRRMGAAALADRDDELARDRPRLRRDGQVADAPARHDDPRGRRHAVRVRVRRLLPERRDELPALRGGRVRGAGRRRPRGRGRRLRRRRDRNAVHGLQGRRRNVVAHDPGRLDRRGARAHELRRAGAPPDRRGARRSRDHRPDAG